MANYLERFSFVIIASLLLRHESTHAMGILRSQSSDSLEDNGIESNELSPTCLCQKELNSVLKRLETLELSFAEYKKTEDDRHFYLTARTQLITEELLKMESSTIATPKNLNVVLAQASFIQDNIMDPKLLQQIAAKIWTAVSAYPKITTENLFDVFEQAHQSSPSLFVPMYEYLFDHLYASGKLTENWKQMVGYLKSMLEGAATTPSIAWTEELQVKLLQRIFSTVENWSDAFNLTSAKFFDSFPSLTEIQAYKIALKVLESKPEALLRMEELTFIKKICVLQPICSNGSVYGDDESKRVFLRPKVQKSIREEILAEVRSNFTDASRIGLKYFENWNQVVTNVVANDTKLNPDRRSEHDLLRSFAVDVFLETIQKGEMNYEQKDPQFFKLLQILGLSRNVVEKYPWFTHEFKSIVQRKFRHNNTHFESIREFLEGVDKVAVPVEVWKFFFESMRENNRLNGNEAFQLGELLAEGDRYEDPIWEELPLPIKLLFHSSEDTKWRVKVHRANYMDAEFFDIVCNQDYSIGLVPINSTGSYSSVWKFDKYDPWFAYKRLDVGYNEVSGNLVTFTIQAPHIGSKGKVMLGKRGDDGSSRLEQTQDFVGPDKDGLTFNIFKPSLNPNMQMFHLSLLMVSEDTPMTVERFVSVLYDEERNPVGLGVVLGHAVKAEFVLFKES